MIHGIINIYKEKGFTSHDVVAKLRGIIGQRKIGHTGTLDPDATGVLPVCLGKATKLCDLLTDKSKIYEAVLLLGKTTDTQDISGAILKEAEISNLTPEAVTAGIMEYAGTYEQIPPMYSAIKVGGKRLYELAREGREIERKARTVTIHGIRIMDMNLPRIRIEVNCSKGTYIRTLCHDIGQKLGCGGCMEELIRTKVDRFTRKDSVRLDEVEWHRKNGTLNEIITPIDAMFPAYRKIRLSGDALNLVYNGGSFEAAVVSVKCNDNEYVRVYNENDKFIAIYRYLETEQKFKIIKMFHDCNEMT